MYETTWTELRTGDQIDVRGTTWTVHHISDDGQYTLEGPDGPLRVGRPDPQGVVVVIPGGESNDNSRQTLHGAGIRTQPLCGHWLGERGEVCGSDANVREFIQGYRCHRHTPSALRLSGVHRRACHRCGSVVPDDAKGTRCHTCRKKITKLVEAE